MSFIDKCKAALIDPHPERDETHSSTREAMNCAHCPSYPCQGANPHLCESCRNTRKPLSVRKPEPIYEPELPLVDTPAQDTHAQKFHAYQLAHPEIYWAIRAKAAELVDEGRERLSMKGIFELLRGQFPHLDNSFTADFTDLLIKYNPRFDGYFERRHRAERSMKLVYTR